MTWTRLSDTFGDSPAVIALSDAAFRAHVTALIWCNKQLTDGAVPVRAMRLFAPGDPGEVIAELIAAGLWSSEGDHYQLDWADQETERAVRDRADKTKERVQNFRERSRRCAAGDHSLCKRCEYVLRNGVTNGARNAGVAPSPNPSPSPSPSPSPTLGEGEGFGGGQPSTAADRSAPEGAPGSAAVDAFETGGQAAAEPPPTNAPDPLAHFRRAQELARKERA